jgi:DsbC/DsbD-like thiol-disulfide interchange protein
MHALGYGGTQMGRTSTRCVLGALALALPAVLVCDTGPALAQAKKSDSVIKVDVKADKPGADGKQTITITLDIDKSWHVYANPVENEDLTNAQTVVSVTSKGKLESVKVEYPAGKPQGEMGEKYKIYEGKVAIKAQVKRAGGDNSPLEVTIKLQACNDKTCLVPAVIKKEVP